MKSNEFFVNSMAELAGNYTKYMLMAKGESIRSLQQRDEEIENLKWELDKSREAEAYFSEEKAKLEKQLSSLKSTHEQLEEKRFTLDRYWTESLNREYDLKVENKELKHQIEQNAKVIASLNNQLRLLWDKEGIALHEVDFGKDGEKETPAGTTAEAV